LNVDPSVSNLSLLKKFKGVSKGVKKIERITLPFKLAWIYTALVVFDYLEDAMKAYKQLKTMDEEALGLFLNGKEGPSVMKWFRNKAKEKQVQWHGVIIRGFPAKNKIKNLVLKTGLVPRRIETQQRINGKVCILLSFYSFEDSKAFIREYKNRGIPGKVNLHPLSSIYKCPELYAVEEKPFKARRKVSDSDETTSAEGSPRKRFLETNQEFRN